MAPVRGDGMRGLAVFISDIRNCKYYKIIVHKIYKLLDLLIGKKKWKELKLLKQKSYLMV